VVCVVLEDKGEIHTLSLCELLHYLPMLVTA
jgi:hypothetical protein